MPAGAAGLIPRQVGNDVVDLAAATTRRTEAFIARVCAGPEQAFVHSAADPHLALWTLFAAKEAAFKVVSKLMPRPVFAHREFLVALDLSSVRYREHALALRVESGGGFVHALLANFAPWPAARVQPVDASGDSSAAVRRLLTALAGERWGLDPGRLEVRRDALPGSWDGFGPPRLLLDGAPLANDLSLSHDGGFLACALDAGAGPLYLAQPR